MSSHGGDDHRVLLVNRTRSAGRAARSQSQNFEGISLTKTEQNSDRSTQVIRVNPDKGSFFHAMISYRVNTDAAFVTNLHNAMNSIGNQRDDLRMLDDFPWPKEFNRAKSTMASGIRIFVDKFCLRDGAQWEGSSQSSGGFVGAILKSLLFVPIFSVDTSPTPSSSASFSFRGSVGAMAKIWNPLASAGLTRGVRGFKVATPPSDQTNSLRENDVIFAIDGFKMSDINALWKFIANSSDAKLCIHVEREIRAADLASIEEWMNDRGFGDGAPSIAFSAGPSIAFSADASNTAANMGQSAAYAAEADPSVFKVEVDTSNKMIFEALGLLPGDEVSYLSSNGRRIPANNPAEFAIAVIEIAKGFTAANVAKSIAAGGGGKESCKFRFKRYLDRPDYHDNVLLELILARELHEKCNHQISAMQPCAALYPVFLSEAVFDASNFLSRKASTKTNEKARSILQLNSIEPSLELKANTLSPFDVFQYFAKFQGFKSSLYGDENNQIEACSEKVIAIIRHRSKSVLNSFVKTHEGNTSQSVELREWLQHINMSYYARVLAHNNISSLHSLSLLDANLKVLSKVAAEGAISSGRTEVSEYHELLNAVKLAKKSGLSRPIEDYFASFVDRDASFMTAAFSSRACDIMFAKPTVQVLFFSFGVVGFAWLLYTNIGDFISGDVIKIVSNLAGLVASICLTTIALVYRFLDIKIARKSMHVVCFLMIACRFPNLYLAYQDPCFKDIQCLIPQRVMSTLWIWSAAIALAFFQRYLLQVFFVLGPLVMLSYAFMGEFAFYKGSSFGVYSLVFGLFLFLCYLQFLVLRRHAFQKSAAIANEHSSKMQGVWSKMKEQPASERLSALCPSLDPARNELFKDSLYSLLDRSTELVSKTVSDKEKDLIDKLPHIWETSTNSIPVEQEYTDIKRLFEEAEFCNRAFQTWVESWLAGGESRNDFIEQHLSKEFSDSMERLYFQSPESQLKIWKFVTLGNVDKEDYQAKLLRRLYALFTSPTIPSRNTIAPARESFMQDYKQHFVNSNGIGHRHSATIVAKLSLSDRVVFEAPPCLSCALYFNNDEDQVVLILFADAFKIIDKAIQAFKTDSTKSGLECPRISLHIRCASETHKISQFIVISDDPDSNRLLPTDSLAVKSSDSQRNDTSISLDDTRKCLEHVDANWTLLSVNGRSRELQPPTKENLFRRTDMVYANGITKTFLNSHWYGSRVLLAFNVEEQDADPANPLTYTSVEAKEKHFEPLRIPVPPLSGQHVRGPIKQVNRTISKIFRSYDGEVRRITDVVRCVVVLESPGHMLKLMKKIIQNSWIEPCNPSLGYQLDKLSLGLKPAFMSSMSIKDRAVVAWTRLQYFFKCNVLGLPRNIVAKSLQEAAGDNVQIEDRPEMPHGAFELLRIRNRFSEIEPEGGYRDVNIKLKIGFRDSESTRHPVFLPVEDWNEPGVKRMVVEIQLHLKSLHETMQKLSSVHGNYIEARNLRSQ